MNNSDAQIKTVLITGASGFVGNALCVRLSRAYRVIGLSRRPCRPEKAAWTAIRGDLEDGPTVREICQTHRPDVVIHCAGLSHPTWCAERHPIRYVRANLQATENLAREAAEVHPDLHFIFMSSVSVYGPQIGRKAVSERAVCEPVSHYAKSKLDAENRLIGLYYEQAIRRLDILRLAPVYDRGRWVNLEKRVLAPGKLFFVRIGTGNQKMSALSRKNLTEFISFRVKRFNSGKFYHIINLCDEHPYSLNEIIDVFRNTLCLPCRKVVKLPLTVLAWSVRIAGWMSGERSGWIHSIYPKLAKDMVFDARKMQNFGFKPKSSLVSEFGMVGKFKL